MAECGLKRSCIFFNDKMTDMPAMAAVYKARYCRHSNTECARWLVFSALGREAVPDDLFPNDRLRALRIVRHARGEQSKNRTAG